MKTIAKGNKQLRIDDTRLEGYLALGYVEVDPGTGKPVKEPTHDADAELTALREENAALAAYAENADKTIEELTAQVEALKAKPADPKK